MAIAEVMIRVSSFTERNDNGIASEKNKIETKDESREILCAPFMNKLHVAVHIMASLARESCHDGDIATITWTVVSVWVKERKKNENRVYRSETKDHQASNTSDQETKSLLVS